MVTHVKITQYLCYIYNEDEIDELILLIRDSFMLAFTVLKDTLVKKLEEAIGCKKAVDNPGRNPR